ncbi:Fbd-associated f-box protein [Thalictrum thalictroides]|uniref:Fbd-associated f-box protein n=1 Tax=Thalictrum thalictroides TaxID=46969 RepID=A0A7J6VK11_THATH|nr:Fbd-associated f-box protein [Thalictrum thalictroides]
MKFSNQPLFTAMKRLKLNNEQEMVIKNEDRISRLPIKLLHKIFSFLDIKYAVQTSVLSTKWRDIWKSLPTLNFNSNSICECINTSTEDNGEQFMKFVDQVFSHRQDSNIQKLRLFYNKKHDLQRKRVYPWIRASIQCNVQELDIYLLSSSIQVPVCLFSCKSLIVLKLDFGLFQRSIDIPRSSYLPSLKNLHLQSVWFGDEEMTSMLFSSCPILEFLTILDCHFHNMTILLIDCLNLRHLTIGNCSDGSDYDDVVHCKIGIQAPELLSFCCQDHMSRKYIFLLVSLSRVVLDMELEKVFEYLRKNGEELPASKKDEYSQNMISLLREVNSAKALTLSSWLIEQQQHVISKPPALLQGPPLQFHILKYLKLKTWFSRECVCAILKLLTISSKVETLIVEVTKMLVNPTDTREGQDTELSLQCMDHLKFVKIQGFLGGLNGISFLEVLLKKATVLEKMVILFPKDLAHGKKQGLMQLSKKILRFPRASSNVAISFPSTD